MRSSGAWWECALLVAFFGLFAQDTARAATRCGITSVTGLDFGSYSPRDRFPSDSAGAVVFECSGVTASDVVSIELGRSRTGGFQRGMLHEARRFEYNLYLDAARTLVWGDGTGGTVVYRGRPADGRPVSVPVYGRIPPRQSLPGGSFSDVVVVTLVY